MNNSKSTLAGLSFLTESPVWAVCLDAGGVLHLPRWDGLLLLLAELGIERTEEDFDRAHYHGMAALDDQLRDDPSPDRFGRSQQARREAMVESLRLPDDPARQLREALGEADRAPDPWRWLRPVRGAAELLEGLRRRGVAVAVVSNADPTLAERLVVSGFDFAEGSVFASDVVGAAKPEPTIFEAALAWLDMPAAAAIHVGDSVYFDVEGARGAGIRGVHYDPLGSCQGGNHAHVGFLADLVALFG